MFGLFKENLSVDWFTNQKNTSTLMLNTESSFGLMYLTFFSKINIKFDDDILFQI